MCMGGDRWSMIMHVTSGRVLYRLLQLVKCNSGVDTKRNGGYVAVDGPECALPVTIRLFTASFGGGKYLIETGLQGITMKIFTL